MHYRTEPRLDHDDFPMSVSRIAALGSAAVGRADPDPFDQPDAASPRPVGGDGVPAGQPEATSHLDHAQAIAAAAAADRGRGGGRADVGPAAQPMDGAAWGKPRRTTSCCWTTVFRCPTAGPTPAPSIRPNRSILAWPIRPRGKTIRRPSRSCAFRRPAPAAAARSPTCSKKPLTVGFDERLSKILGGYPPFANRGHARARRWKRSTAWRRSAISKTA